MSLLSNLLLSASAPAAPADMDVGFVLICAALVFLMQAGFCMLESGMIRAKNSINVAVKNLLDFGISMLVFAGFGFALMFGCSENGLFGWQFDFWHNNELSAFALYQMVFCGTTATIVSGAVAERTRLSAYLFIVFVLSAFTYPLIGHWCWGGALENTGMGWLALTGFSDWAGATVVHVTGGFAALGAILAIGPRRNYKRGKLTGGHSLTLAIMGCFLLWFGWWGFNGGSGLSAGNNVSKVLLNTNLGAVAGLIAASLWSYSRTRKTNVVDLISGTLAGLVSVTGACHVLPPLAAIAAGAIGAIVALWVISFLRRKVIDDAVGAFGVHGAAGFWGTLAYGFFAPTADLVSGDRTLQISIQMLGALIAAGFSFSTVCGSLLLLKTFMRIRVKAGEEKVGLNVVEHGATNEVTDLLGEMYQHRSSGDYRSQIEIDTDTEVGQIATEYNSVIARVNDEVNEHRITNNNLHSEKLRLQSVLEHAGVGIYQLDETGHFQSANSTLLEIFGYPSASELISRSEPFSLPGHNDTSASVIADNFRRGRAVTDLESECFTNGGEKRWLLESIVPVRDENGCLLTWLGTVHDITDGKQAMIAEVEIAEAKSLAKGEFLANMSHEIRTPLNGVIGMLDLLASSQLDRKDENYINIARSSADSLLALINDILDFSKIEAGRLELEKADFDLSELMESTAEQFSIRAHLKGLEMNCELGADLPHLVTGDPERLRQSIINLLANAIKFTETGEINLRVTRRGSVIRFAVQDTGIGIPAEVQESLFDSFVQADVSTTRRYGGTGLGLSIVKQLVQMMGGSLKVDSVVSEGSEFWFELPLPVAAEAAPTDQQTTFPLSELSKFNVLIVDDNATNCEILVNQLRNWGLRASVCNQPTAVVQKMLVASRLEKPFDLVILDFCMPEMNGRDVAIAIKEDENLPAVPIIMLSSNSDLLTQRELEEADIDVAMTKPARQSRLFDSIVTLLHGETTPPAADSPTIAPQDLVDESPVPTEPQMRSNSPHAADILIAEDNRVNQLVVQQMLETLGYTTEVVDDGLTALQRIQSAQYGLVLMDGHMPDMDGVIATKHIRQWESEVAKSGHVRARQPIVALTANVVAGIRQECLDAGMDEYLCKPITLERLREVTERYLGKPKKVNRANKQTVANAAAALSTTANAPASPLVANVQIPKSVAAMQNPIAQTAPKLPLPVSTPGSILLDQASLAERCSGDVDFQNQLLKIMRDSMPERLAELQQAQELDDVAQIRAIAHQLKGAAGDTALLAVRDAASELELHTDDNNRGETFDALRILESRIEQTLSHLEQLF